MASGRDCVYTGGTVWYVSQVQDLASWRVVAFKIQGPCVQGHHPVCARTFIEALGGCHGYRDGSGSECARHPRPCVPGSPSKWHVRGIRCVARSGLPACPAGTGQML
eukprot:1148707-Pelagomonas_calceolata.AAC.2